nr:hypothetical protein HUO10_002243 [Paraburkholderia busanensis]
MTSLPLASLPSCRRALDIYIDAKDDTRPERIAEAFAGDAVLTMSLATSNIAFPARTVGADAIARTLVIDFGKQYTRCRTYYVCDALEVSADGVVELPWLVVMREPAAGALRVGHGVYRWTFDDAAAVTALHIHIARMDVVADGEGRLLDALQAGLAYPWLTPDALRTHFDELARGTPELAFAKAFSRPAVGE